MTQRPDERQLREVLDFAVAIATEAGAYTLEYFSADTPFEMKSDNSPVTVADRGAEERLRQRIEAAFPTHGILGEELGEKQGSCPARWILDPIDGTVSFISGVPLYSVLVGFEWAGEMLAGVIHMPALAETVYAARGLGCSWKPAAGVSKKANGGKAQPARVSEVAELARARVVFTSTKLMKECGRAAAFERLREACYTDRGWSDAYAYALLATGRAEIVLDPRMNIWDTAAVLPVVTEAGGTLTDWSGQPTHTAPEALATNGKLLDTTLQLLNGPE